MPMKLEDGWNQIVINLADFCKKAYGTNFVEVQRYFNKIIRENRIQIHSNCLIRRIYFSEKQYFDIKIIFSSYFIRRCPASPQKKLRRGGQDISE